MLLANCLCQEEISVPFLKHCLNFKGLFPNQMSEMFYVARKEQKNRSTFAYSGEYLKTKKKLFKIVISNVLFGILTQ